MSMRAAIVLGIVALFACPAMGQIENPDTSKTWEVRYAKNDNIPGHPHTDRRDLAIRVQILKFGNGPRDYTVNIWRYDRLDNSTGNYGLRLKGGRFLDVPLGDDTQGNGNGRKRMLLVTAPQTYTDNGVSRQVKLIAVWHTGQNKATNADGRKDDRLHIKLIDREMARFNAGDCPEDPDTDVLEETPLPDPDVPPNDPP
jgi:hypothetical protein